MSIRWRCEDKGKQSMWMRLGKHGSIEKNDRRPMVRRPSLRGDGRDVRDAAEQRYGVRYNLLIARI